VRFAIGLYPRRQVHERNVDSDFLLIILRDLLQRKPSLRVVLMSATMNADLFADYFTLTTGYSHDATARLHQHDVGWHARRWVRKRPRRIARRGGGGWVQPEVRRWRSVCLGHQEPGRTRCCPPPPA
jgi:hypothetical protein